MHGQTGNNSPYTRYGYGSLEQVGFGKNQAMGGIGIATRSGSNLSPLNPASYTGIDSLSQIFEIGVEGSGVQYRDIRSSSYSADMNFNYFAIGFPAARWWGMGLGVIPTSKVGYDFGTSYILEADDPDDETTVNMTFYGEGGISKMYWSNGFELFDRLSLGVTLNYYFGSLDHYRAVTFPDEVDYIGQSAEEKVRIGALQFSYGLQYMQPLSANSNLVFGAIYESKRDFNAKSEDYFQRLAPSTASVSSDLLEIADINRKLDMDYPESFGFGANYILDNKLEVGADYYYQKFSEARFLGSDSLQDRQRISIGLEYTPNYLSPGYLKRVRYRLGGHVANNYQKLFSQDVYDIGITFGLGLPLGYSKTSINLALEYGKRGTTENDLVREDYIKFVVNLSLNDVWFVKRKFK